MPTQLTTPITQSATTATLDGWELVVVRNPNLSVNVPESYIIADFVFRNAQGAIISKQRLNRNGNQLPQAVLTAIANLQTALLNASRAAGILPAGTDTPDF